MALDVIVGHKPSITYTTVGRSFYTMQGRQQLSDGIEVWQGYYQSVRPTYKRMLINVDLSATVFYRGGPLVELITRILGQRSPDDLRTGIRDKELTRIERIIKGLKIKDNHRAGKS